MKKLFLMITAVVFLSAGTVSVSAQEQKKEEKKECTKEEKKECKEAKKESCCKKAAEEKKK